MSDDVESLDSAPEDLESAYNAVLKRPDFNAVTPQRLTTNPVDAHHNVEEAIIAVETEHAQRGLTLGPEQQALHAELRLLSAAMIFAHLRVHAPQPPRVVNAKLSEARRLRSIMLPAARACANAELLPDAEVTAIEKGKGPVDTATDLVELAALYRRNWAVLENATPATQAMVDASAALGSELLGILGVSPADAREAQDKRDRLWALLLGGYEKLWMSAAQLWGSRVSDELPKLHQRPKRRKPKPAATPETPTA